MDDNDNDDVENDSLHPPPLPMPRRSFPLLPLPLLPLPRRSFPLLPLPLPPPPPPPPDVLPRRSLSPPPTARSTSVCHTAGRRPAETPDARTMLPNNSLPQSPPRAFRQPRLTTWHDARALRLSDSPTARTRNAGSSLARSARSQTLPPSQVPPLLPPLLLPVLVSVLVSVPVSGLSGFPLALPGDVPTNGPPRGDGERERCCCWWRALSLAAAACSAAKPLPRAPKPPPLPLLPVPAGDGAGGA